MTEAAQADPGGLERSSYTWQVRRSLYEAAGQNVNESRSKCRKLMSCPG
jgi:hypothetical protein